MSKADHSISLNFQLKVHNSFSLSFPTCRLTCKGENGMPVSLQDLIVFMSFRNCLAYYRTKVSPEILKTNELKVRSTFTWGAECPVILIVSVLWCLRKSLVPIPPTSHTAAVEWIIESKEKVYWRKEAIFFSFFGEGTGVQLTQCSSFTCLCHRLNVWPQRV